MAKKRPSLSDAARLDELFPKSRNDRGRRHQPRSPSQKKYPHSTYRLLPGQHDEIKDIANEIGVDLNELVRFMFADYIHRYHEGELELPVEKAEKTVEVISLVYPQ